MSYQSKWTQQREAILTIAGQVKADNPAAWNEVKIPGQKSRTYINLVSIACLKAGIPAGVNLKRGGPEESLDAIALPNETGARDSTGTYAGVEIVDIIGGAESQNANLAWSDVTQPTIDSGNAGGWKAGSTTPTPPPAPTYPSYEALGGDAGGAAITHQLESDYKRAGRPGLDGDCGSWQQRVSYDFLTGICKTVQESITKHRKEWCDALGIPVL